MLEAKGVTQTTVRFTHVAFEQNNSKDQINVKTYLARKQQQRLSQRENHNLAAELLHHKPRVYCCK